jgi:transcriptional regulator of acetoin/glycerol metabolism
LREDLYYRLSAATFVLPPLREREDFDWLTQRLLDGRARLSRSASASLRARDWPGNLRELGNALAVAVALCEGGVIERADLPPEPGQTPAFDGEAEALRAVLARCGGNVSEAARQMHVDRTTIHRRMRRLGVAAH